jgi:hypothetical protein
LDDLNLNLRENKDTVDLPLRYEDDDSYMGITLQVTGPDSPKFIAKERKQLNERQERYLKNKKVTAEMQERQLIDLLQACIVDWTIEAPALADGAEPPECTKQNKIKLLQNREIREQVNEFVGQRRNFRDGSD